jgi:leucyl-tRNA---protein transferase
MLEDSPAPASLIEYRDRSGRLLAALLADRVTDGWSAVYSFFEPEAPVRSLGSYMILDLIRKTGVEGRAFVYLGYWIAASPKMAYKARFAPVEVMDSDGWRRIAPLASTPIIPVDRTG